MGFTVVDVNMRGTGCSGGAFDFFEPLQGLDGYDVIETVARQPWVKGDKVGMMGISYGGISQLFTGADPAAEPGRDHADLADRPGADDALSGRHPQHRLRARVGQGPHRRRPAGVGPNGGQPWAYERIQEGDERLRGEPGAARRGARPAGEDPRATATTGRRSPIRSSPITFVDKINVPTFLACQWKDEQTGGHCPTLAVALHRHTTGSGSPSPTGPTSTRSAPETFNRWFDFLKLYVAKEAPALCVAAAVQAGAPVALRGGVRDLTA